MSTTTHDTTAPKRRKGLLIGLIVGGAVLVAAAVTLIILALTVWSGPSRGDFEDARAKVGEVRDSYQAAVNALPAASSTLSDDAIEGARAKFDTYKQQVDDLAKLKVMKEEAVKHAYDQLVDQQKKLTTAVDKQVASINTFKVLGKHCQGVTLVHLTGPDMDGTKARQVAAPCLSALNDLSQAKDEMTRKAGQSLTELYETQFKALDERKAALDAGDQARALKVQQELQTKQQRNFMELVSVSKDHSKELEEADTRTQIDALDQVLADRLN